MDKELKKYFQMKSLISIYAKESNADTFLTGYINEMDDEGMIINHITPYGTYDGYVYIRKEDIFRIEIESKYIKRLEKLMLLNGTKKHEQVVIQPNKSLLFDFFSFIQNNHYLIRIQLEDEYAAPIIGFIQEIKEEILIINQINEDGEKNGITLIKIDNIHDCESDTIDEQIIMQIL